MDVATWSSRVQELLCENNIGASTSTGRHISFGIEVSSIPLRIAKNENESLCFHIITEQVDYLIQLLPSFCYCTRRAAFNFLIDLEYILAPGMEGGRISKKDLKESIDVTFREEVNLQEGVSLLFANIGKGLGMLGQDLVVALEALYCHENVNIRSIAIMAVSTILKKSQNLHKHLHVSLWNLYFMLEKHKDTTVNIPFKRGWPESFHCYFLDSLIVTALSNLLQCNAATCTISSKQVLMKVLSVQIPPYLLPAPNPFDPSTCLGEKYKQDLKAIAELMLQKEEEDYILDLILVFLSSGRQSSFQYCCILLEVTLTYYSNAAINDVATAKHLRRLVNFTDTLMNLLLSFDPIIRNGALMCLTPILKFRGDELCTETPDLFAYIVYCAIDCSNASLSLALMNMQLIAASMDNSKLVSLLDKHSASSTTVPGEKLDLNTAIRYAIKLYEGYLPRAITSAIITNIRKVSRVFPMHSINALHLWALALKIHEDDIPLILNTLLPLLASTSKHVVEGKLRILSIVKKLVSFPEFESAYPTTIEEDSINHQAELNTTLVLSYLVTALNKSENDLFIFGILDTLCSFRVEYIGNKHISYLLDALVENLFVAKASIRCKIYSTIGKLGNLWERNIDILIKAIASLVIHIGEISFNGITTLIESILTLGQKAKTRGSDFLLEMEKLDKTLSLHDFQNILRQPRFVDRIPYYHILIGALESGKKHILTALFKNENLVERVLKKYDIWVGIMNLKSEISSVQFYINQPHNEGANRRGSKYNEFMRTKSSLPPHDLNMMFFVTMLISKTSHNKHDPTLEPGINDVESGASYQKYGSISMETVTTIESHANSTRQLISTEKLIQEILWSMLESANKNECLSASDVLASCFVLSNNEMNKSLFSAFIRHGFEMIMLNAVQDAKNSELHLESIFRVLESVCGLAVSNEILEIVIRVFVPHSIQIASRNNSDVSLRLQCLHFIIAVILRADYRLIEPLLEPVHSMIRGLFSSSEEPLLSAAIASYPLIVHIAAKGIVSAHNPVGEYLGKSRKVPIHDTTESPEQKLADDKAIQENISLYHYLIADLEPIRNEKWKENCDPMLQNLTPRQRKKVVIATIVSLGVLPCSNETATSIVTILLGVIRSEDAEIRGCALEAVLSLAQMLSKHDQSTIKWMILPFLGDSSPFVRYHLCRGVNEMETVRQKVTRLATHLQVPNNLQEPYLFPASDDLAKKELESFIEMFTHSRESILLDISYRSKNSSRQWFNKENEETSIVFGEQTPYSHSWQKPLTPSTTTLRLMKHLIEEYSGLLHFKHYELVEYHLQMYLTESTYSSGLGECAAILLSELARNLQIQLGDSLSQNDYDKDPEKRQMHNQVNRMLQSIVRTISSTNIESLALGCSFAIQNVVYTYPSIIIPVFIQSLCDTVDLSGCHLLAMKRVFISGLKTNLDSDTISNDQYNREKSEWKDMISPEKAKIILLKLLSILTSTSCSTDVKKSSLTLVAEIAGFCDTEEYPDVFNFIISFLEKSDDAGMHELCQKQLVRIFNVLPVTHPLIGSLIKDVDRRLTSSNILDRQRAITMFSIVASMLPIEDAYFIVIRALADPESKIRIRMLKLLILYPPEFLKTVIREKPIDFRVELSQYIRTSLLSNINATKHSKYIHSNISKASLEPTFGSESVDESLSVNTEQRNITSDPDILEKLSGFPLQDDDPNNNQFVRSDHDYINVVLNYGFDLPNFTEALFTRQQISFAYSHSGYDGTINSELKTHPDAVLKQEEFIALSKMMLTSVISYLIKLFDGKTHVRRILEDLSKDLKSGIDFMGQYADNVENADSEVSSEILINSHDQNDFCSKFSVEEFGHKVKVYLQILCALEKLGEIKIYPYLKSFQVLGNICREKATIIREKLYAQMQKTTSLFMSQQSSATTILDTTPNNLPITSAAQYFSNRMLRFPEASSCQNDSDISRELSDEAEKSEMMLETYNHQLWEVLCLQSAIISGLADVYSHAKSISSNEAVDAFDWLMCQVIGEEHRGLRKQCTVTVVALTTAVDSCSKKAKNSEFSRHLRLTCIRIIKHLTKSPNGEEEILWVKTENIEPLHQNIMKNVSNYRGRIDLLYVLGKLITFCESDELTKEVAVVCVYLMKDDDSNVRQMAMTVVEWLEFPNTQLQDFVLDQIRQLIRDPKCREKEYLSRLLQSIMKN